MTGEFGVKKPLGAYSTILLQTHSHIGEASIFTIAWYGSNNNNNNNNNDLGGFKYKLMSNEYAHLRCSCSGTPTTVWSKALLNANQIPSDMFLTWEITRYYKSFVVVVNGVKIIDFQELNNQICLGYSAWTNYWAYQPSSFSIGSGSPVLSYNIDGKLNHFNHILTKII